MSNEIGGVSLM